MNEAELLRLFETAILARAQGAPIFEINELIAQETGGEYAGLQAVAMSLGKEEELVQSGSFTPEGARDEAEHGSARRARWADVGPLRNFGEGLVQGGSFGGADDVLGQGFRTRREDDRALNPRGAAISEAVGTGAVAGAATLIPGVAPAIATTGVTRGAAVSSAIGAGLSGTLAFGEADAGGRDVSIRDRLSDAAAGAAAGGVVGLGFGFLAPVARGLSRMLRSDKQLASEMARKTLDQTGATLDDAILALRRRKLETGDELANFADVDPVFGTQARRFAGEGTATLRRLDGPLAGMRGRVTPEELRKGVAAIYEPFNNRVITDKVLLRQLRNGREMADATRTIMGEDISRLTSIKGTQIQSIRGELGNRYKAASNRRDVDAMVEIKQAQVHFDKQVERAMPGYAQANTDFQALTVRTDAAEALIKALDVALPRIESGVPQAGGIYASIYRAVGRPQERDAFIKNMVAEALLADGEAGITLLSDLILDGTIAKMFKAIHSVSGPVVRGSLLASPGGLINPDRFSTVDPNQVAGPAGDLGPFSPTTGG